MKNQNQEDKVLQEKQIFSQHWSLMEYQFVWGAHRHRRTWNLLVETRQWRRQMVVVVGGGSCWYRSPPSCYDRYR